MLKVQIETNFGEPKIQYSLNISLLNKVLSTTKIIKIYKIVGINKKSKNHPILFLFSIILYAFINGKSVNNKIPINPIIQANV